MRLEYYMNDGSGYQAKAILAFLQGYENLVEGSWSDEWKAYRAEPKIARWENGREQGYVLYMPSPHHRRQINIAFYEHRSSDSICATLWESDTMMNSPKLKDMPEAAWEASHWLGYGNVAEMAKWIKEAVEKFWNDNINEPTIGQVLKERREKKWREEDPDFGPRNLTNS